MSFLAAVPSPAALAANPSMVITILVPFLFKLAGAVALWIVGTWLIRMVLKVLRRTFNKSSLDPTLIGFLLNILGALVEALRVWQLEQNEPEAGWRERHSAARARTLVNEAILWMQAHLGVPFAVTDLATGLSSSVRALQYAFHHELGHPPLAEARRLRLRALRQLLLDPEQSRMSIGMLMAECGLLGGGSTARDYRSFWGELPRRTRQRLGERDSAAEDGRAHGWARPRSSLDC